MAWSSVSSATQLTSITTEQFFDVVPQLNPGESAHVTVEVNFPGSPTDDAIISIYGTIDGTNYDDTALFAFMMSRSIDPHQVSFLVSGVYQFRVGVKRSGTTDTFTSADMGVRTNGISV